LRRKVSLNIQRGLSGNGKEGGDQLRIPGGKKLKRENETTRPYWPKRDRNITAKKKKKKKKKTEEKKVTRRKRGNYN